MRILPMGDRAILVEVDSLDSAIELHARLEASRADGIVDLVPAARTVLVRVDAAVLPLAAARAWVASTTADAASARPVRADTVELEVVYDGADLVETAELLGLSAEELVRRHTSVRVDGRVHRVRPGLRLPRQPRLDVRRAPAAESAHARPARCGRPRRPGYGRVSA